MLQNQPDDALFKFRRFSDGKWLSVVGWNIEWCDTIMASCPAFTKENMGRDRSNDFVMGLYDRWRGKGVLVRVCTMYGDEIHKDQPYRYRFPKSWLPAKPKKPKRPSRAKLAELGQTVLNLFPETDQDNGGDLTAADFLDLVGQAIENSRLPVPLNMNQREGSNA